MILLSVICMFCICFTFYLHFVCIAAGDDEAAAAAVAAAADAVDVRGLRSLVGSLGGPLVAIGGSSGVLRGAWGTLGEP